MLRTKVVLSYKLAKFITGIIEEEAEKNGLRVCIAIVNDAGQLICFVKMDESTNASGEIAIAKAKHAINYKRDTKFHEDLLAQGQLRVLALPDSMPIDGGVQLILEENVLGAIGVSGAPAIEDGKLARLGALSLTQMNLTI